MKNGINITDYAQKTKQPSRHVLLTTKGLQELNDFLLDIDKDLRSEDAFSHMVAAVNEFLKGSYHKSSIWFKTQTKHSIPVLRVTPPGKEHVLFMTMEITELGYELSSGKENPLDDYDYFARRLIEEVVADSPESFTKK